MLFSNLTALSSQFRHRVGLLCLLHCAEFSFDRRPASSRCLLPAFQNAAYIVASSTERIFQAGSLDQAIVGATLLTWFTSEYKKSGKKLDMGKGFFAPSLPSKNAWQGRKDIVNLTADVVRIKASAEQFEDQRAACLRAWRKLLPAISCTLSLIRSLSHFRKCGLT